MMVTSRKLNQRLITAVRLCGLLCIAVWLWGCQSSPQKGGGAREDISSLSTKERQSFEEALKQLAQGKPQLAEKRLAQLQTARPQVAEVWLNLALSQYHQGAFGNTEATLQTLRERFTHIAEPYNLSGLLAVEQGKFKKAEQYYKQALQLKPQYSHALFNMALLQDVYLQDIASAVDYYERYLALEPDDTDTKNWAAGLKMSLGQ